MRWTHSIISTSPAPVSRDDVKRDLDITFFQDDALIDAHIAAAVDWVQTYTGRFMSFTTVEIYADGFASPMSLPFGPFQSLTSLKAGSSLLAPRVLAGDTANLLPASGSIWPYAPRELGSVVVRYVVGYAPEKVPPQMIQAVKLVCSIFYDKPDGSAIQAQWDAAANLVRMLRLRSV